MMTYLIYDGTFEGLLTVLRQGLSFPDSTVSIVTEADYQPDLFSEMKKVATQSEMAQSYYREIAERFSREICLNLGYVFISELPGIEDLLLSYLRELDSHGQNVADNFANPIVFKVRRLRDQVNHEILRFYGFVRFRKMENGIFYAPIEPDYNVVQLLAPHFKSRFADQQWLIHDVRRSIGIFYDKKHCVFLSKVDIHPEQIFKESYEGNLFFDGREQDYQTIWNHYFKNVAITERTRKKLQRQNMPTRYWKYLVEEVE